MLSHTLLQTPTLFSLALHIVQMNTYRLSYVMLGKQTDGARRLGGQPTIVRTRLEF